MHERFRKRLLKNHVYVRSFSDRFFLFSQTKKAKKLLRILKLKQVRRLRRQRQNTRLSSPSGE